MDLKILEQYLYNHQGNFNWEVGKPHTFSEAKLGIKSSELGEKKIKGKARLDVYLLQDAPENFHWRISNSRF